jgi:hypothetical protein
LVLAGVTIKIRKCDELTFNFFYYEKGVKENLDTLVKHQEQAPGNCRQITAGNGSKNQEERTSRKQEKWEDGLNHEDTQEKKEKLQQKVKKEDQRFLEKAQF